jgi:hypothetical protein
MPLNARAIKVTLVLDPGELAGLPEPSTPRVVLKIKVADGNRLVTADLAAKAIRKARAAIAEHGAAGVACILQGKLVAGDAIVEAGLVAAPKAPKAAAHEQPAAPAPSPAP